jgi:hypothetical protein
VVLVLSNHFQFETMLVVSLRHLNHQEVVIMAYVGSRPLAVRVLLLFRNISGMQTKQNRI